MSNVSFSLMPNNWRVPGAYAEFDNSNAISGTVAQPYKVLILGQLLSGTPLVPESATKADQVADLFGKGSMLHRTAEAFFENDDITSVHCVGLADDAGGALATGSIVVAGAATAAGTLYVYLSGDRYKVGVSSGDSKETVATAIAAVINAHDARLMDATVATDTVTLKARHKGEAGNELDVRVNYNVGEALPAGITVTINALTGGTANPDIAPAFAALGDEWYNLIVMPYTDAANLAVLEAELADRFGPLRAIDGYAFAAKRGNHSALLTLGDARNSPHVTIMENYAYPKAPFQRAAMVCGQVAMAAQNDVSLPFQTLVLEGDMAPAISDRFDKKERNLLLFDGISTAYVDAGNLVRIEFLITTYQENAFGAPDQSYLRANTLLQLSYLRFSWHARVTQKFPRFKLGDNGAKGDKVMTPKRMDMEMIALAGDWADMGLIESVESFKAAPMAKRNTQNPDRLDMILPPDLMNQLRVVAARIDFRL